jgi:D-arginine dehydrogenase
MPVIRSTDYLIVGSGIAGASAAYWLAPHARVLLLERESQPGYHSTGRSAAMFAESYGTPQVRALTCASRAFLQQPPPGFCEHPVLSPRGLLLVARLGEDALLDEHWRVLEALSPNASLLLPSQLHKRVPVLRQELLLGGCYTPDALDMDVSALHQGYLRGARQHGAQVLCNAPVTALWRHAEGGWLVQAGDHSIRARVVVNAAGAWCDEVAQLAGVTPLGLTPKRRSAFVFAPPTDLDFSAWPLCIGADESWYLKPDAGQLLGSAANADPVPPQDVQPEELDIALGIHRIEELTTLKIHRPTRTWAGLRSFVPDGDLVCGYDSHTPDFFWIAGQGGYGIQTSAAMGEASAALLRGLQLPARIADFGLTTTMLGPRP